MEGANKLVPPSSPLPPSPPSTSLFVVGDFLPLLGLPGWLIECYCVWRSLPTMYYYTSRYSAMAVGRQAQEGGRHVIFQSGVVVVDSKLFRSSSWAGPVGRDPLEKFL